MDKLRAITFFCRAVEHKSFAAAASALDVVPSALSKTISALEREVGFKLVRRSTRALSLTDEGARYYEECRRILQQLEDAEATARGHASDIKGTLRVGVHPGLRALVFGLLGELLDEHPRLRIETLITNAPAAVVDEGLDIVVRIGSLIDSSLVARHIGDTEWVTCASPAYIARWGAPAAPEDLARHRAVIYGRRDEEPNSTWEFVRGRERCRVSVPIALTVRDGIGLTDAALGGCGIARPFEVSVRRLLASGQLQALLTDWSSERLAVYGVLPSYGRGGSAKVSAFIDVVEQALARRG